MTESDPYFQTYRDCEELYKQAKYTECTKLALDNLMDSTMPRYYLIKTLLLLVGAENDSWGKAEKYRVRAEKEYATTKRLLSKPNPAEEASLRDLRTMLDTMLEYQANEAPPVSFKYAHYPAREGTLMDFLYEREVRKDSDEAERVERDKAIEEAAEELAEELEEMELDDDDIPLEVDEALRAAEPKVVGEIVNITQALRETQLEGQKASSDEAAEEQQDQKASSEAADDM